nr:hypothetical protein [Tanacetum cinerariifolium]
VNAVNTPVTAAGLNPTNSTNNFNTASPSDTAVSPNFGIARKSSFVDLSKYPDDPDMPELEDIVYSDDEEDVGAEADLSNLETNISVCPITTSRVHKDLPKGKRAIGSKWVFRNKKEERGIVIRNKARLVAQGHTQEKGIDYDEVFAPVARIEAIRLFLAYASFMGFLVYQIDVKSDFLYGTIEEEVYVCQPLGFKDPDYPDKVYKVVKALYGLHQAPRAWYETLANYLLENGLQVKQKDDGIFISQDKYVAEILRKFGFTDVKSASTPIETKKPLLKDLDSEDVDVHIYRYLKGKPHLGLWYLRESPFNLVAYSDSDYAGASLDRKFTTGGCQFLDGIGVTAVSYKLMLFGLTKDAAINLMLLVWASATIKKVNNAVQLRALIDGKKVVVTEDVIRQDLHLDYADGVECLPNKKFFAELARMGYEKPHPKLTFYKAFFSTQWKFLIHTLVQCVNAKRTAWNKFSYSMASALLHVESLTCLSKGFSRVETLLFATMLVQPQPHDEEETKEDELPNAPTPPSPTNAPSPLTEQDPTPTPHTTPPASPPQEQPTATSESSMSLLNTLMETWGKIEAIDADEDITLVDVETKYQSLKRKPVSIAQARKSMIIYLKNMVGHKMEHFRDVEEPKKKRVAEETLLQENFKKLKAVKVSVPKFKVEALQVKYPIIDWKIHSEGSKTYWKIIRVGGITKAYQSFEDMLKGFNREDLVALWSLVKENSSSAVPNVDKEKALWVELKRLFKPDADDVLWKLQRHDMFMLIEKDYPLSNGVMTLMLSAKLQVKEDSEMAKDLVMKIFIEANKPKSRNLKKMHQGINAAGLSITAAGSRLMLLGKDDSAAEVTGEFTLKKDYPLSNRVMTLMLSAKLQVKEDSEMARDLVMKIFMEANKPKSRSLDTSSKLKRTHQRINAAGLSITAAGSRLMLLGKDDSAAEVTGEITLSN